MRKIIYGLAAFFAASPFLCANLRPVAVGADIIRPRALNKRPYEFYRSQMQDFQQVLFQSFTFSS